MSQLITRLYEDPVFFVHAYFHAMGWDQFGAIGELEEDAIRFATGLDATAGTTTPVWRIVKGYRMQGKTRVITIGTSLWRAFRDAERRIIYVSASADHARRILATVRASIEKCSFLKHLAPRPNQRDRIECFDMGPASINPQPSFLAMGIDGQLSGPRAHSVYPDDVETEDNSLTIQARDALESSCDSFSMWLYKNRSEGQTGELLAIDPVEVIMPGTSKHDEDSLYERLARRKSVAVRSYPIVAPAPGEHVNGLAPVIARRIASGDLRPNESTSSRWSTPEAHEKMSQVLPTTEAREYRLIVGSQASKAYPIRLEDLIVADWAIDRDKAPVRTVWGSSDADGRDTAIDIPSLSPTQQRLRRPAFRDRQWAPYSTTRAFVDPSGQGEDKTGFAAAGELAGTFYVKFVHGLSGAHAQQDCDLIAVTCRTHAVHELFYEGNADPTRAWEQLMTAALNRATLPKGSPGHPDGWSCTLTRVPAVGQKEKRIIATLRPVIAHHRMVFDRAAIEPSEAAPYLELQYQLSRITEQRHSLKEDGKIDALAGLIATWTSNDMNLTPTKEHAEVLAQQRYINDLELQLAGQPKHWMFD